MEEAVQTTSEFIKTSVTPPHGTQSPKLHHAVSSSYSEDSEPESPRSPSPKVSPGSHAPDDDSSTDECHNIPASLPQPVPSKLPHQQSIPYEPSSGASSHASSQNNLDNFPETDLKEAEQELLDEMIVKDVPDSASSTDPVKLYEDSHPSINSIREDQEDNSTTEIECKDPSLNHLGLATSTPSKPTPSLHSNESSPESEPSHEMPIDNDIRLHHAEEKNIDDFDMEESCLAAPDSKDSLEVQVYSVCEDLSEMAENYSGKDESFDGIKAKQESSDSEGERESILNDKSLPIDPEITVETPAEVNVSLEEGFEMISNCEQTSVLSPIEEKSVTISEAVDDVTTEEQRQDSTHSSNEDLKNVEATYEIVETIDFNEYKFSPGILHMVIHRASQLENSDYIGKSDPYVTVEYNQQKFKSNTIGNTLEPEWNFSFDILVKENDGNPILLEVFDDDYDQDDSIGCVSLDMRELMNNQNNSKKWYDLTKCKTGKVQVSTTFEATKESEKLSSESEDEEIIPKESVSERKIEIVTTASSSSFEEPVIDNLKNYAKDSSDYDEVPDKKVAQKDSSDYDELSDHKFDSNVNKRYSSDYDELSDNKFEDKVSHVPRQQDTIEDDEHETSSEEEAEEIKKKRVEYDSSDYETQDKSKKPANYDSSDYSSISNVPIKGKRPDSFISDTSSDYEISDGKPKRPESFVLDDEYDVITEEDVTSSKHEAVTERRMLATSSSSEFEGPDKKEIVTGENNIAPPAIQIQSLRGDKEHDGENGISQPSPNDSLLPEDSLAPLQSSVASGSLLLSSDLHAEQSSVNVDVAESSVINSNTLEEIDPLAKDQEINTSTHVSNDNLTTINPSTENSLSNAHSPSQSTPRCSSSSISSVAQVLRDGSSDTNKPQDTGMSKEQDGKFVPSIPSQESVLLPQTPPCSPSAHSVNTHLQPEFPSSPSAYTIDPESKQVTRKADFQDVLSKFEEISRSDVGTKRITDRMSSTESSASEKPIKSHFKITTGSSTDASSCSISHSTVRQPVPHQDTITDSSDYESSSHQERRTSTSSSEVELAPISQKKKSPVSILKFSEIGSDPNECMQQPERSPLQKAQFDAFVKPAIDEIEDVCEPYEHKPIPKTKEDNNINSAELFTRQLKEDIFDTVLHEDDDSQMSESPIENLEVVQKKAGDYVESMQVIEQKFKQSLDSVGKSQEDASDIEYDKLGEYHAEIPKKKDPTEEQLTAVMQAEVKTIEEPDWEIVEVQEVKDTFSPGVLHVIIHKGSELENSDYIGKSDPYVTAAYNQQKFKSDTIGNTLEPEWNYEFDINVTEDDGQPILIEVFDDDYDQDDPIGCVSLDIEDLIRSQESSRRWFDLNNCKSGKIQVSATFQPKSMRDLIETEEENYLTQEKNLKLAKISFDDPEMKKHKIQIKDSPIYDESGVQDGEEKGQKKRAMTPEKALELATEIVQNVQTEAIKKYEEIMSTQSLPKPTAGSKFTIETKEKVQEYLKEMEDSEAYDQVASELIQKVVTKKEERLKRGNQLEISVDITEEEPRSDAMLNELRNELRRNSISITDEDLKCDFNSDLLEEHAGLARHLDEVRSSLGAATAGIKQFSQIEKDRSDTDFQFSAQILEQIDQQLPTDFRFQTSFRSHFVQDGSLPEPGSTESMSIFMHLETRNESSYSKSGGSIDSTRETSRQESSSSFFQSNGGPSENQPMIEDIWAEESKVVFRKDFKGIRDKKSDTESTSSGSRHNLKSLADRKSGTDHEGSGWSSSTETSYLTAEEKTKTTNGSSRPSSSDVDAMLSAVSEISSTSGTDTYKTAQDISTAESSVYHTAGSSLSSRESVQSSESSGNLASFEVSECSETLVESSLEFDPNRSDTPSSGGPLDEISFDIVQQRQHLPSFVQKDTSTTTSTDDNSPDIQAHFPGPKQITASSESKTKKGIPPTPEEIQLLDEDDIDGNCLKGQSKDTYDEEREFLISESKDTIASRFSESRETLSSSVLTLSSMSDATIIQRETKEWEPPSLSSEIGSSQVPESEKRAESLSTSLITQLTDSTSSTSTSGLATHSTPNTDMGELQSSTEEMKGTITNDEDQVFPLPRMRSFEGTQSVHFSVPQQMSLDFGSDYDSRPVSELGEHSRPQSKSERAMSGSSSTEGAVYEDIPRSHSVEEKLSDCLKVNEPFVRPVSPLPNSARQTYVEQMPSFGEGIKTRKQVVPESPIPSDQRDIESAESIEAEIAFSKHFTQVLDDTGDYDTNDIIKTNDKMDLTPESLGTSDSVETSQGQEYLIDEDSLENKPSPLQPHFDIEDQDDLLVGSPPMVSRPLGVKYWPPLDNLDQELDGGGPVDKRSITRSESDDNSESRLDLDNDLIEKEVEEGKRWLENQFEGPVAPQEDPNFYGYGQPLDQILEEEEDRESHSSIDNQELMRLKESLSSTPDFDVIINKRHLVSKSAENDDVSLGSLTEFERLEREVALGSGTGSRGSIGSNDSLEMYGNGNGKQSNLVVKPVLKPETSDNVSVLSFEMMEKACVDADNIEKRAKEQEEVLSEIEEGHESQVSESESGETVSECEAKSDDEYEDRMFKIDEIIRQAQSNVENFEKDKPANNEISLADIMGQPDSRTESVGHCSGDNDSLDGETVPDLPKERDLPRQSSMPSKLPSTTASRTTSVTSLHSMASITSVSTLTQFDADSMRERDLEIDDIMQASADSLDLKMKSPDNTMITSTDSLEATRTIDKMTFSTDSIENGTSTSRNNDAMTVSVDSLDGSRNGTYEKSVSLSRGFPDDVDGATAVLQTSTDSFESSSTNTRATASMLSSITSITSQGSETLVADDEFEFDNDDSINARRYLLNQGNIPIEDSDDSVSHSSPLTQATTYSQDFSQEEILETHEIDSSGNRVVRKLIQKRIDVENKPNTVKFADRKVESYFRDLSEKRDDSCEETIEEIDEFGNKRKYIVKRSIEPANQFETLDIVHDRRQQRGLSPIGDIFRSIVEEQPQSILEKRQPIHHTETMTKVFDAPPSTPSPPSSPLSSSFRVSPPALKKY